MSFYKNDLVNYVIDPILERLGLLSNSARELLLGTCAVESNFGTYLHQVKGPALSIYQIEGTTYYDLFHTFLCSRRGFIEKINEAFNTQIYYESNGSMLLPFNIPNPELMITNLAYATVICRLIYYRVKESLPKHDDIRGLANYWKVYYNTSHGKGEISDFLKKYEIYVRDKDGAGN